MPVRADRPPRLTPDGHGNAARQHVLAVVALAAAAAFLMLGGRAAAAPGANADPGLRAVVAGLDELSNGAALIPRTDTAAAPRAVRVPVLMFHRVAPPATSTGLRDLIVDPATFAAEMRWLRSAGYHPIRQAQLEAAIVRGAPLPPRPIVLTFDDGYKDAVTRITPILRRYGWPATFFVITGRTSLPEFLTWPQIEALDAEGMDIGSHTVRHISLAGLPVSIQREEIDHSEVELVQHLGHRVPWFAYPAGSFDATTVRLLAADGYRLAYTTQPGALIAPSRMLTEPRVRVPGRASAAEFAQIVRRASGS